MLVEASGYVDGLCKTREICRRDHVVHWYIKRRLGTWADDVLRDAIEGTRIRSAFGAVGSPVHAVSKKGMRVSAGLRVTASSVSGWPAERAARVRRRVRFPTPGNGTGVCLDGKTIALL